MFKGWMCGSLHKAMAVILYCFWFAISNRTYIYTYIYSSLKILVVVAHHPFAMGAAILVYGLHGGVHF